MRNGVQILSGVKSANPKTLLPDTFKAGIVTLEFCPQSIDFLKGKAVTVNGKSVVVRKCDVLYTAPVFLSVVPISMVAWTG